MNETKAQQRDDVREVKVTLDATELQKALAETLTKYLQEHRRINSPTTERRIVGEDSKDDGLVKLYEWAKSAVNESVLGVPSTFHYIVDLIHEMPGLFYDPTQFFDVREIPEGSDSARWFIIPLTTYSETPEGSDVAEVSQTITSVSTTPIERSTRQVLKYSDLENATIDLIAGITRSMTLGALRDSFKRAVDTISQDSNISTIYGDGSVDSESEVTAEMKLSPSTLASARRRLMEGAGIDPGVEVAALISPKQYTDLLMHQEVKQLLSYGSDEPVKRGQIPTIYGIRLYPFDVPSGTGAGTPPATTYRAIVFHSPSNVIERPIGLAIKRKLLIENVRDVKKRQIDMVATYKDAVAVKDKKRVVRIITA
ncbi:MAG: hypothetical protein NZ920_01300 [Aigarchaeota archaeon]|nr:hypothetical protein [Aigarchaeota archaeon]MDW8093078.1 hypothetical protein [Nitrososphaerota archaeon]